MRVAVAAALVPRGMPNAVLRARARIHPRKRGGDETRGRLGGPLDRVARLESSGDHAKDELTGSELQGAIEGALPASRDPLRRAHRSP